jgi:hypothetical protein
MQPTAYRQSRLARGPSDLLISADPALAAPFQVRVLVMLDQHEWWPVPAGELGPDLPHGLSDPTVITSPAFRSYGQADPRTPGLTSRDRRQVRKPGSRHLTPCVSLDPAAVGQGGRSG